MSLYMIQQNYSLSNEWGKILTNDIKKMIEKTIYLWIVTNSTITVMDPLFRQTIKLL